MIDSKYVNFAKFLFSYNKEALNKIDELSKSDDLKQFQNEVLKLNDGYYESEINGAFGNLINYNTVIMLNNDDVQPGRVRRTATQPGVLQIEISKKRIDSKLTKTRPEETAKKSDKNTGQDSKNKGKTTSGSSTEDKTTPPVGAYKPHDDLMASNVNKDSIKHSNRVYDVESGSSVPTNHEFSFHFPDFLFEFRRMTSLVRYGNGGRYRLRFKVFKRLIFEKTNDEYAILLSETGTKFDEILQNYSEVCIECHVDHFIDTLVKYYVRANPSMFAPTLLGFDRISFSDPQNFPNAALLYYFFYRYYLAGEFRILSGKSLANELTDRPEIKFRRSIKGIVDMEY